MLPRPWFRVRSGRLPDVPDPPASDPFLMYTEETPTMTTIKQLRRSRTDKMVAGVCGGVAEYLNVDATLVRVVLVAATILGAGCGALVYVACWMLMPARD
jgi:phage shock protein C